MSKTLFREGDPDKPGDSKAGLSASPGELGTGNPDSEQITITASAAKEIARQRAKLGDPDAVIRIGVRGGGCGGYAYAFDWAKKKREGDRVFSEHGVTIYVDKKSFEFLKGMVLDHVSSMMGHGFKFENPNAKSTCGCGESVQF